MPEPALSRTPRDCLWRREASAARGGRKLLRLRSLLTLLDRPGVSWSWDGNQDVPDLRPKLLGTFASTCMRAAPSALPPMPAS
jgi:hypothetical protein